MAQTKRSYPIEPALTPQPRQAGTGDHPIESPVHVLLDAVEAQFDRQKSCDDQKFSLWARVCIIALPPAAFWTAVALLVRRLF